MPSYTNQDGLEVRFGRDIGARGGKAGVTTGAGKRRELIFEVDLKALGANGTSFTADNNNDGVKDGFNQSNTPLPSNVRIDKVSFVTTEAPAGGTSFEVGTYQENGTAVNVAGLLTAAGAQGAQVGTQTTQLLYAAVKATGTYTAGRVKVIVEYLTV